jgi:hypothetical protein
MAESMSTGIRVLFLSCTIFGVARFGTAGLLYNQPSDYPNFFTALTSQNQASGASFQSFDDFTLSSTGTIESITWQGLYCNFNGGGPATPNTTSFQIGFFANDNNLPSANPVSGGGLILLTGVQSAIVGTAGLQPFGDTVNVVNFSANLQTPFAAQANTTYWLSIVSFANSYPPGWLWTSGTGGDGKSAQLTYGDGNPIYPPGAGDRAFSLSSSPQGDLVVGSPPTNSPVGQVADAVPEPGTLSLAVIAVVCLAAPLPLHRSLSRSRYRYTTGVV